MLKLIQAALAKKKFASPAATHLHLNQLMRVQNDTSLTEIVWAAQKALLLFYTGQVSAVVVLIAELVTLCNDVGLLTSHLAQPIPLFFF